MWYDPADIHNTTLVHGLKWIDIALPAAGVLVFLSFIVAPYARELWRRLMAGTA